MKIVTVLGTRPEIIRLSRLIPLLDAHAGHVLVHTGQNSAASLSDLFFAELGLRAPDHSLGVAEPDFARQIGRIMTACHDLLLAERPDRLLVLGDTNSAFAAVVARRLGIPVFHMEAGNRCFDPRVPEEVNRRIIDHSSDVLMPYTERSRQNLLREGFASERVHVTGNPIHEVMRAHADRIAASPVLDRLGLAPGGYLLATLHRAENVDRPERLAVFAEAFQALSREHGVPVVVSTHPRTRGRLAAAGIEGDDAVRFMEPFGFLDFVALETHARCVLSDSGTVQEECSILRVPNVTLRDVTERPETVECGSNLLTGCDRSAILRAVAIATAKPPAWQPPPEYLAPDVSGTVLRILTGHHHGLPQPAS
ncbi:UDP-N-acetylglucosamine 2-epimerase (non-hydrolyzing) [Azospirillum sp. RWY-5-1]|uniref:UDP-N-acetylglucosamine 2-epimerase (Non-hydrolyzing) n=1 Tax=Azospirillum oleiclasticum TaxID=2735135 RepID=A0ABX2TIK7_9PROT|nr:UDP-N-acetylglucosamine 2-epimerase (non-hydrolyzing) [Azospirillum oleiclasticum]NYZ17772.1 UDP-N-acetylglucosamine 2-epimerase (non-hydrolyzing) [Azospirillum oleiclasticum]NYZ24182.1 UDP-N-acetylglucosamine 2-epimerase (non-hydrolyzing) [Azospirillum oleiclasticum]